DGSITFKYGLILMKNIDYIQLNVYAIDNKTLLNDTALIHISFNEQEQFEIPIDYLQISLCPNVPILLSDQSLPGKENFGSDEALMERMVEVFPTDIVKLFLTV
ncbi:unnamed protein product, partial [Rotaria sordida]